MIPNSFTSDNDCCHMLSKNNLSKEQCNFRVEKSSKVELRWRKRFEDLKVYKARFGNCNVPRSFKENVSLGIWVAKQRSVHKAFYRKDPKLSSTFRAIFNERFNKLNGIGFQWKICEHKKKTDLEKKEWAVRFEDLLKYKCRFGHCNVPRNWDEDPSLALWVRYQRILYKKFKLGFTTSLTKDHIEILETIGFTWVIKKSPVLKDWETRYKELKAYKLRFGNCHVPRRWEEDPSLGRWVRQQRQNYSLWRSGTRRSAFTREKMERLECIGFAWTLKMLKIKDHSHVQSDASCGLKK